MKVIFYLTLFLTSFFLLAKDFQKEIEKCREYDAVCVGSVLLKKMDQISLPVDGSAEKFNMTVNFYKDDHCGKKLLARVMYSGAKKRNQELCEYKAKFIDSYTLSYKVYGVCTKLKNEYDFLKACKLFE